jgi:hypothetical protein
MDIAWTINVAVKGIIISKSNKKSRKTHSDKFPLTLHPAGQFCKKIKGKIYYFGKDKQKELESYLEQAVYLHSGKFTSSKNKTKIDLANQYLDHQKSKVSAGEIRQRQLYDQTRLLKNFNNVPPMKNSKPSNKISWPQNIKYLTWRHSPNYTSFYRVTGTRWRKERHRRPDNKSGLKPP